MSCCCLLLMVAVTANLAGLFEIGSIGAGDSLTRKGGIAGSFWTGVLAAVVATPCTGPFMAAAIGRGVAAAGGAGVADFCGTRLWPCAAVSAIGLCPGARRRMLPKPGSWMGTFTQDDGGADGADRAGVAVVACGD